MGKMNINRMSGTNATRADFQRDVKGPSADEATHVNKRTPVSEDKLDISSRAAEVGKLVDQLKSMDDVRGGRIDALRGEILAGTYNPDGDQIADAMLKKQ